MSGPGASTMAEGSYLRAAVYELLSRLLSAPAPEHGERSLHLAFTLSRADDILSEDVRRAIRAFTEILAGSGLHEVERAWQGAFGLTDGGPLSLCESEYGMAHIFQKSGTLADICGFYRAFGLERAAGAERPDHLCVEFEFLAFLASKQAHALRENKSDPAEIARAAERMFLSEHTGKFCIGLFKRMAEHGGFYASVASLGIALVEWSFALHGITQPDQLALTSPGAPEEPMSCGASCPISAVPGEA